MLASRPLIAVLTALLTATLLAACGGGTKAREVEVRRLLTSWAENGTTVSAADPDVLGISLLQDDGAGGVTRTVAHAGGSPGVYLASPATGPYWAEVSFADGHKSYVRASADRLDLGQDRAGRADRVVASAQTDVTLTLSGLEAWLPGDEIRLASWGAQSSADLFPPFGQGDQQASHTFDWATTMGVLLTPADLLSVAQYRFSVAESNTAFSYLEVLAATSVGGLAMTSGAPQVITPAVTLIPEANTLALDWRRNQLEDAAAPYSPSTAGLAHRVGLYAIPAPLTAPSPLGAVPVTLIEATDLAESEDIDVALITYGRFLPAAWHEYRETAFETPVERFAPLATAPLLGARQRVISREAMPATGPAAALVGAVLAPTLDGLDALATHFGVRLTPTLAWAAAILPAGVVPTSYSVAVHELTEVNQETSGRLVADFSLAGTSLSMPAGLLQAGRTYVAVITARVSPGEAGGASPYRVGVPYGEASLWTETFTTAP